MSLNNLSDWTNGSYINQINNKSNCTEIDKLLFRPKFKVSSVQSLSCVWLFATPWTTACQASLSITNCQSLPKHMPINPMMPTNHLILCCPVPFSSCPQSFPASGSFQVSQLFAWGGQGVGISSSTSVLQWTPRTDLF